MGTVNRTIKPRKIVLSQKVHLQSFVLSTIAAPVDGPIVASLCIATPINAFPDGLCLVNQTISHSCMLYLKCSLRALF
jgi:hypothetical protein